MSESHCQVEHRSGKYLEKRRIQKNEDATFYLT